ncbi:MAG: chromate resistance protein [Candidatus Wallbacteria bacterium]|nr:chromate resistance protein [Candidatus Wallbacteria bacterium]
MKWVTRAHVQIDRVACPWLIKRFIDSEAEFTFVAKDLVLKQAAKDNAIPFDIQDVELGHHGKSCSFVAIMEKYNLKDRALLKLAEVVNAADTGMQSSNPYAPGLDAIARGFSLLHPDDFDNLEAQFMVYDALYTFFRLGDVKVE